MIIDRAYPSGTENAVYIPGLLTCAAVFYLYPSLTPWDLGGTPVNNSEAVRYIVAYHAPSGDISALGSPSEFLEKNIDVMRDADASNVRVVFATPDNEGAGTWPPLELTTFQKYEMPRLRSLSTEAISVYIEARMSTFGALWSLDSTDLFLGNIA